MSRRADNLTGKRIGCYEVLHRVPTLMTINEKHAHTRWHVRCATCGFEKDVCGQNLQRYPTLKCTHVPAGWRCIGPEDVALLESAREAAE